MQTTTLVVLAVVTTSNLALTAIIAFKARKLAQTANDLADEALSLRNEITDEVDNIRLQTNRVIKNIARSIEEFNL